MVNMARHVVCSVWSLCRLGLMISLLFIPSSAATGPKVASRHAHQQSEARTLCGDGMCWCSRNEATCSCKWVDVSYLPRFPDEITAVRVTECEFPSLTESFTTHLANVSSFNLAENKITWLPKNAFAGTEIADLNLSFNTISRLPKNAFAGAKIQSLDLSYNLISRLPQDVFEGANISNLDLSFNVISDVTQCVFVGANVDRLLLFNNHISGLPQNAFAGAKFRLLELSCNKMSRLSENAFTGIQIDMLKLSNNQISDLSQNTFAYANINVLDLSQNQISVLSQSVFEGAHISSLLLSSNSISEVSQITFAGTNITTLRLSGNKISLHENAFAGMELDALDLSASGISTLPQNVFAGVKINILDLSDNKITNLSQNTFTGAQIDHLILGRNRISSLPQNAFAGANVNKLHLSRNHISSLAENVFAEANINDLDLTRNNISLLSENAFAGIRMNRLDLSFNHIRILPKNVFAGATINWLKLLHNSISGVAQNSFVGSNIDTLDLSFNRITWVPRNVFANTVLKTESLRENIFMPALTSDQNMTATITNIALDNNPYSGVYTLEGFCDLPFLHSAYLRQCHFTGIQLPCPLMQLSTLDLTDNLIDKFPTTCGRMRQSIFPALTVFNITRNRIKFLSHFKMCLPSLRRLDVSYNHLYQISLSMFRSTEFPFLKSLYLGHQTFSIHRVQYKTDEPGILIDGYPFGHTNLEELDLSSNQLKFSDPNKIHKNAFLGCKHLRYLYLSSNNFVSVDDERFLELFGHLNSLVKLSLSHSKFESVSTRTFANFSNLTTLFLDNNMIADVPDGAFDSLESLQSLYLHNNKIRTLYEHTFSKRLRRQLSILTLRLNPFLCSCDLLWFRQWYATDQKMIFKDAIDQSVHYKCQNIPGMALANFSMTDQACLLSQQTNLLLIQFCSIFIFILTLVSVVFHYRWHLRLLMYEVFRGRDVLRRQRLRANNFDFDVFVSYASEDLPWVREHLMPKLENELGLRPCIHDRDFIPGCHIVDNIVRCVEGSKKILMVFSTHFVRSQWCQFELALYLSHVLDYDDALIVVCVDDVTSRQMTSAMMAVIKTTTYIQWREEEEDAVASFWGRLRLALHEILPHDNQYV